MKNFGLADFFIEKNRKRTTFLDGIDAIINWSRIEKILKTKLGRIDNAPSPGVKAYPALLMFKILLLQQWYGLSDQDTEFALLDRISFSRFTRLSLHESVPDHTTICRFRNLLVEKNILKMLLDEINRQTEKQGKLIKKGVAVDASIIASAARPRKQVDMDTVTCDREEGSPESVDSEKLKVTYSHDPDAAWLKKGKECHYGYKVHTAVDAETGLVLAVHVTPANYSDTGELERLVEDANLPEKTRIYADKGYTSKANSNMLKEHRQKDAIMSRAYRNKPLSKRQQSRNRLISKKRYIVERVFGTLKKCYDLARASYIGKAKVQGELLLSTLAYNLKRSLFLLPA
jgi:Transposase and inactivated derivatives, IS5 family